MAAYTIKEKVFIVKRFYMIGSVVQVQRNFRTEFNTRKSPSGNFIKNIVKKFETTGSVLDNLKEEPREADDLLQSQAFAVNCSEISSDEDEVKADNDEKPQPTPSTSTVSKAEDNFEFISMGAIKQEEPGWMADPEGQKLILQKDLHPDSRSNTSYPRSEELEPGLMQIFQRTLEVHISTNNTEEPFQCGDCNEQYKTISELTVHSRRHPGKKLYRCGVCNKHFRNLGHLETHHRLHSGEKPYQCTVCKKQFNQLGNLRKHELIHTGEKPYQCGWCEKQFNQLRNVKTHELIHTGEKPYHCSVCKKQFRQLGNVKKHEQIHMGEKPFQCEKWVNSL